VEVTYLTWTDANLLGQVSYQGSVRDKLGKQIVRPVPHKLSSSNRESSAERFFGKPERGKVPERDGVLGDVAKLGGRWTR
jgi:hypothetical protein